MTCNHEVDLERHLPLHQLLESTDDRTASPARPDPATPTADELLVHRWHHEHSILSTMAFPSLGLLFCGTYDKLILVLDMVTFERKHTLRGHTGSVLSLAKSGDEKNLFSGGSDSLVKVWDVTQMKETHTIYSLVDIGDIFSLCWCNANKTIYFGCQNASILFVEFDLTKHTGDFNSLPSNRFDKFFDSKGPTGVSSPSKTTVQLSTRLIEVPSSSIISYAHNGFIYSLKIYDKTKLISGGGDGMVNIWDLSADRPKVMSQLDNGESVLSIALYENFLYCGLTNGQLKLWDLQTHQQLMTLQPFEDDNVDEEDTLTIAAADSCVYKASKHGITKWKFGTSSKFSWEGHQGLVLTSEIFVRDGKTYLVTGGDDSSVALWNISDEMQQAVHRHSIVDLENERLLQHLRELVAFKTVSKKPELFIDDSRRCAHYLTDLFAQFGAESKLIPVKDGNPIVYACFKGRPSTGSPATKPARILWYGHYDVIEAEDGADWNTNPFKMVANDGYLYGRGVSDNKGPNLAAIYAASDLLQTGQLMSDVVFLIEGEEECGSFGFQDSIKQNIDLIGDIDWILLSNSYWLDETTPCLNYGLRGVLSATVEITGPGPDRHSGVDGGVSREPMVDLIKLLSKLTDDDGKVLIPQFYNTIKDLTPEEEKLYDDICSKTTVPTSKRTLLSKWKFPSLSVHKIDVSGPGNSTVIPKSSKGFLSLRVVPEQNCEETKQSFLQFLEDSFAKLNSENNMTAKIVHEAESWLGDRGNAAYEILENEIVKEWGMEPLYIREGGSIPSVRFLEKTFGAAAAQIPCGQSTDNAHLDNERLRVANLYALRRILHGSFKKLLQK